MHFRSISKTKVEIITKMKRKMSNYINKDGLKAVLHRTICMIRFVWRLFGFSVIRLIWTYKRVITREISSRDETRPRMKSSLSMVKCLLLFTRFCRDEISSRDERQGWNFIPGWKKEKKTCKHFIPGWNFKMSMFLINFWRMYSNMLSKVNVFEHNESMNIMKHKSSLTL